MHFKLPATATMRQRPKRLTTKDTKKNCLVTLSFVLFVSFVVNSLSCLNLCNLRNLWFLVLHSVFFLFQDGAGAEH